MPADRIETKPSSSEVAIGIRQFAQRLEPGINGGSPELVADSKDGWTVRTKDGRLSAQFEHTILMTEDGPEILTITKRGPQHGHRF